MCEAGSCHRAGSEAVLTEIEELAGEHCSVKRSGCLGACSQAPNVAVVKRGRGETIHTRIDDVHRSAAVVQAAMLTPLKYLPTDVENDQFYGFVCNDTERHPNLMYNDSW